MLCWVHVLLCRDLRTPQPHTPWSTEWFMTNAIKKLIPLTGHFLIKSHFLFQMNIILVIFLYIPYDVDFWHPKIDASDTEENFPVQGTLFRGGNLSEIPSSLLYHADRNTLEPFFLYLSVSKWFQWPQATNICKNYVKRMGGAIFNFLTTASETHPRHY
jgi:hypothetical protein